MNPSVERAWFFYQRRRYDEALEECRGGLAADPHDLQLLFLGGLSALLVERVDVAREMAESLLAVAPASVEGHELSGYIADSEDQSRLAEQHFREALRQAPERAELHAVLGNFLGRHGRIEDGITAAFRGLSLSPENAAVLRTLEQLYRLNDEPERAEAIGAKALAADPEDADAHLAAGLRLLEARRGQAATASFREALRLEPADGKNLDIIAYERVRNHPFFRHGFFLPIRRDLLIVTLTVPLFWWLLSLLFSPLRYMVWISLAVIIAGYSYRGLLFLCRKKVLRDLRRGQL